MGGGQFPMKFYLIGLVTVTRRIPGNSLGQRNHKRRRCPFPAGLGKQRAISIYLKVYPRPSRQALIARK